MNPTSCSRSSLRMLGSNRKSSGWLLTVPPKPPPARGDGRTVGEPPPTPVNDELVRRHVRGSSLLLAGRALQLASNLAVQLLIVRYLSKTGYGEFAYALAIVTLGE